MSTAIRKIIAGTATTTIPGRNVLAAVLGVQQNRNRSTQTYPEIATNGTGPQSMKSTFVGIDVPNVHLVEYVMKDFGEFHDKIATECGFTGRKYTYDDVRIKTRNLSRALRKKLKLDRGDVVALLLPNIPEFPICIFGILSGGLKLTTINPTYTAEEIKRQLEDSNAKTVITINALWNNARTATELLKKDIPIVVVKETADESIPRGAVHFNDLADVAVDFPYIELPPVDETVILPYSSGTTGLPKGVMLSSRNLVANIEQMNSPENRFAKKPSEDNQDCFPAILPMFHIYGFTSLLCLMSTGIKTVALKKFTPESYIQTLVKHKPNVLLLVPPVVMFLSSHPAVKSEYFENLETTMCGAAPLGPLDEQKFREKVAKPCNILQGYGLTETSPVVLLLPLHAQGKYLGSLGHPVSNTEVKVVDLNDPELRHLGPNQTGELLVKGPQVMRGYHNKPEETANTFADGWLRTGDMVYYDEDNMFYIADRIKELIKVKGFQVPPAELEQIIRDYPGVGDAAVIGVPDAATGEAPRAYVVPKPGSKVDTAKLNEFVSGKVAKHKWLRGGIVIVDGIPKNASGKTLRKELKEKYATQGI